MRFAVVALAITFVSTCALACGTFLAADGADETPPTGADAGGGTADGGVTNADGSSAADVDATTSVVSPCGARFCCNFDDDPGPDGKFNWDRIGPNVSLPPADFAARTERFLSPPRSFHVSTDGTVTTERWLEYAIADASSGYIQLALRIDAAAQNSQTLELLTLNCASGGDAAEVRLATDGSLHISGKDGQNIVSLFFALAFGQWTTVRLEFTKVIEDGEGKVSSTLRAGGMSGSASFDDCDPELKVRLGATTNLTAFDVSFDDVAIDWR